MTFRAKPRSGEDNRVLRADCKDAWAVPTVDRADVNADCADERADLALVTADCAVDKAP